ncbi:hypothetical protein FIV42_09090 [Persicimonas caeni]|uniref:Uncharacterized protein n=1 Tax=Persicimonas caeni TaxID=2292766 RepID=A0A4Y6PRE4_PERCE|nr:hypothetical protein [Persicimonas caeni]QDG50881.1 hypothetical protein FIV42_09090 [Persicimonas caeni]QED32102.1 hypothetical protein FRD00_09085 [Persicimonas caeni]
MLKKNLIGLMALALCAGLSLTACGDDDTNDSNNTNNQADTGTEDAGTEDGGDMDADDGGDMDADQGCTSDDDCADGEVCDTNTGMCVAGATGCDLTGDDRPARCDQGFDDTEFGPGSLVTSFQVAGRSVGGQTDPECCFDYTPDDGNDGPDNALGATLLDFGQLESINQSLTDSIADGSLILIFEHDGLTDLSAGEEYAANFWLGEDAGDGTYLIDPASIDQGTFPQARVPNATINGDQFSAGPGVVQLSIDLLGTPLSLRISNAQLEATIDDTDLSDGVTMTDGKLGGVVKVSDILDGLNGFASTCTCMGLEGDDLISYDPSDIAGTATCNAGAPEGDACEQAGEGTCGTIASNCDTLVGVLPFLADIDTDGDGSADAVSIGAKFETTGATFSGIATAE